MNEDRELKKRFNEIIRRSHENSKLDYCLCCCKKVTSFCNSHSLPRLVLKNISDNGMVLTSNNYFKVPLSTSSKGVNNSGTFKRVCKECDNKLFKNYENEEQLLIPPRKRIMTQIDLKNNLRMYDKRLNELALYEILLSMNPDEEQFLGILQRQAVNKLDLNEIKKEFHRDMKILNKNSSSSFNLIYWKKLDYITPIAFQGHIALQGDLNGKEINNLYDKNDKYVIENINLCVFPLKNSTIVMMFVNKDNKKYNQFIKQFNKLNEEQKLKLIAYIIFNYSEDFFISPKTEEEILNNHSLDFVTRNVTDILALNEEMANYLKKVKLCELMNYEFFPNILSQKYSLKLQERSNL